MTRPKQKSAAQLQRQVDDWNAKAAIGTPVDYRSYPEAPPQRFATRTVAEVLSGHTAVVWLDGKSGCVCIDACVIVASIAEEAT